MQHAPSIAAALLLCGCMDRLMEAPYVLATGLGSVSGLVPTTQGTLLAATPAGIWEVDEAGGRTLLYSGVTTAITSHGTEVYALSGERVLAARYPNTGAPSALQARLTLPGALDVQAWCDETVLIATPRDVHRWTPKTGELESWNLGLDDIVAVSLRAEPTCAGAWVLTRDALYDASPGVARPLHTGLENARAIAVDGAGQPWIATRDPAVLLRLRGGEAEVFARYLGAPNDLHFGVGSGLLPATNVYIATLDGTIDYVHVPAAP